MFAGRAAAALPDIKQAPAPTWDGGFTVVKVGSQVQLQFPAEIDVLSDGGPLTITGSRKDTSVNTMDAFQAGVSGVVGALQYNFDPTHQHWHYLALDRYDLRTHDPSLTEVARDQKTGFCLVQSAQINPTNCQQKNPSALSVSETINAGFSDIYDPSRDGQYIDVTGLNGTYEFVQWVNADCRLADMGPAQHTWATVLRINATASTPTVSVTGDTPLWNGYYAGLPTRRSAFPPRRSDRWSAAPPQTGSVLSSVAGSWLERMANEFGYQWRRCDPTGWACQDIPGATAQNYVPTAADIGHTLRARVTGTFIGSSEQGTPQDSEATAVDRCGPTAAPSGPGQGRPVAHRGVQDAPDGPRPQPGEQGTRRPSPLLPGMQREAQPRGPGRREARAAEGVALEGRQPHLQAEADPQGSPHRAPLPLRHAHAAAVGEEQGRAAADAGAHAEVEALDSTQTTARARLGREDPCRAGSRLGRDTSPRSRRSRCSPPHRPPLPICAPVSSRSTTAPTSLR